MFERILFLCTGNICRSPMAEAIFKNRMGAMYASIQISSAGLAAVVDKPATSSVQSLMQARKIDVSTHRARQLTEQMVIDADLILVMEKAQKKEVIRRYPFTVGKIYLLGHWGRFDVPDPYGFALSYYEHVLKLIDQGIDDWLKKICKE